MYHHEFKLESCKYIFRIEDMTLEEQELWMTSLRYNAFDVENASEIFKPFAGEVAPLLNEDIMTQELRVRVWTWTKDIEHKILDINAWPGDNESGIIAIDGQAVMRNSDQNLSWLKEDDTFKFDDRFDFFMEMRKDLSCDAYTPCEDLQEDFDKFFASKEGKNAIKIDAEAGDDYDTKLALITNKHNKLKEKYHSEFTFIETLPIKMHYSHEDLNMMGVIDTAMKINYKLTGNLYGRFDYNATFKFVKWGIYTLVTIFDHYDMNTYLLDKFGKIKKHIYRDVYLLNEPHDKIERQLAKRIHSYLEVMRR